jgi:ABC-type sugar transport system substrate-binding protein
MKRFTPILAAGALAAGLVAGGGAPVGAGTEGEAAAAAAAERIAPYLEPVTEIPVTTPLDAAPETGRSLYWLEGNIQSILPITSGFQAATEALGWELTTITYDPSDPQGPNAAMQQAVDAGADFIAISGQPVTAFETALAAAKGAEIPVFAMFGENETDPEAGIVAVVGGLELTADNAHRMADFMISDSAGEANILITNLPDFTILRYAEEQLTGQLDEACTTCTHETIETTIADLTAGAVPGQIVSYLQSNPDTQYVFVPIGDMATGLPEALDAAGIDVNIVGGVPNVDQIQSLIDGTSEAWMTLPRVSAAWQMVDAMARYDQGMDTTVSEVVPLRPIYTPENVPSPAEDYAGVPDFEEQWKALWGVG